MVAFAPTKLLFGWCRDLWNDSSGVFTGGTSKGQAYGFDLKSLDVICHMKTADQKQTLLEYVIRFIGKSKPECW